MIAIFVSMSNIFATIDIRTPTGLCEERMTNVMEYKMIEESSQKP